jgi:hypothetical protein
MNTILIRQGVFDVTSVEVTCSAKGKNLSLWVANVTVNLAGNFRFLCNGKLQLRDDANYWVYIF